jgi:hypothetical protein
MRNIIISTGLAAALVASACVQHRPIRNGLRDESVYLDKAALTNVNPKLGEGSTDDGWLFRVITVATSSPNVLGDYIFPGMQSETQYVRLRFAEEALQVVDGRRLVPDDPNNPNDDTATTADRVMLEFAGSNVDIKLQESLDGERTNLLSENTEEPWQKRQKFKVDFEKSSVAPITQIAWFYGAVVADCVDQTSITMVPGSFQFDESDQYMDFVLEVTYAIRGDSYYGCWDLTSYMQNVGTVTIQYRFSFYRPGPSDYPVEVIPEKDIVNKTYGSFQILTMFEDPMTGLLSAKSLLQRWNPNRPSDDPVVYYFTKGFPPMFKADWGQIKQETNRVLEEAGATLRLDFREYNDGGIERNYGDLRYSFVAWHQDPETTRGLLGYGPTSPDPRTGEAISANVNLYNIGMDWYRYLIQNFLDFNGGTTQPDPAVPWEQTACTRGETAAPVDSTYRLQTALFEEMRRTMNISTPAEDPTDDFVPTPVRDDFLDNWHRVLPELRYGEPGYNMYVWGKSGRFTPQEFRRRMSMERDFERAIEDLESNRNPFSTPDLASPQGIAEQAAWREQMHEWLKNHQTLQADIDMTLHLNSISVFNELDAINAIKGGARLCKDNAFWESNAEYTDRIVRRVVARTGIHEFGHTMSLRHNFYASADAGTTAHPHMRPGEVAASVMDYVQPAEEAGSEILWGGYDEAALSWIYGTATKRTEVMGYDYLYCTDEHADRSPLCRTFDLGVTPSQIVLNQIENYDWLYDIRNQRAFRTFWDLTGYAYRVYNAVFPMQRFWYLGVIDWGHTGVQDTLKRLDQVENKPVMTPQQYNEIADDFYRDLEAANNTIMAFYDAVINEAASFRNYQTEYDPYYGDVLRMGIITDKLFTTLAFMDLQEVYDYDPNFYSYVAMYDVPYGNSNVSMAERVLDNFLGANYDTFPWFQYTAIEYFAYATNSNLVNNIDLRERIAIQRFNTAEALAEQYPDALSQALQVGNTARTFTHDGERYIYTFVADRSWHLVARESRSPVSFQYMKDYNESLNAQASTDEDNYGLKILLAYYEYYNNFQGF